MTGLTRVVLAVGGDFVAGLDHAVDEVGLVLHIVVLLCLTDNVLNVVSLKSLLHATEDNILRQTSVIQGTGASIGGKRAS